MNRDERGGWRIPSTRCTDPPVSWGGSRGGFESPFVSCWVLCWPKPDLTKEEEEDGSSCSWFWQSKCEISELSGWITCPSCTQTLSWPSTLSGLSTPSIMSLLWSEKHTEADEPPPRWLSLVQVKASNCSCRLSTFGQTYQSLCTCFSVEEDRLLTSIFAGFLMLLMRKFNGNKLNSSLISFWCYWAYNIIPCFMDL